MYSASVAIVSNPSGTLLKVMLFFLSQMLLFPQVAVRCLNAGWSGSLRSRLGIPTSTLS